MVKSQKISLSRRFEELLTTWVFDFNPIEVCPCFTASLAYSIYRINEITKNKVETYLKKFSLWIEGGAAETIVYRKHFVLNIFEMNQSYFST